jgi:hypothetical protein
MGGWSKPQAHAGSEIVAQDVIGQDFSEAIRPVFFETEHPDFLYATHGGTVFVVEFRGRAYGLTCGHVFKDFGPVRHPDPHPGKRH